MLVSANRQPVNFRQMATVDDLELDVGDPLVLVSAGAEGNARHNVRVVGYFAPRSILVTTPRSGNGPLLVKEGQVYEVRLKVANRVVGFSTHVVKANQAPFPYLHLQFPSEMEAVVSRREPRVDVRQVVAVRGALTGDSGVAALMCNLSVTGCRLSSAAELAPKGGPIELVGRFRLVQGKREVMLKGVVRNVSAGEGPDGEKTWHHGVEFVDNDDDTRLTLQAILYDRLFNTDNAA